MQYTSSLSRSDLIKLATKSFFENVDKKKLDSALACFHDGAIYTEQTSHTRYCGKEEISNYLNSIFNSNNKISHKDFTYTVDKNNGRIAVAYSVEYIDNKNETLTQNNTAFMRIRDDKLQEVYVYVSQD